MGVVRMRFLICAALVIGLVGLAGCDAKDSISGDIAISISPKTVYVVEGSGSSCVASAKAKADASTFPEKDLSEERALYKSFQLQWRSPDELIITSLVVEATGSALPPDTTQNIVFEEDELKALTGLKDLVIEADPTRSDRQPYTLASDETRLKGPASSFAVCGFHISGIKTDPEKNSGNVNFLVTIRGYATDANGNQRPIRQWTTVTAEKL